MSTTAWLAATGVLLLLGSAGITHTVIAVLGPRASSLGLVDHPGGRKDHEKATPLIGGIAIIAAVMLPILAALLLAAVLPRSLVPEVLARNFPLLVARGPQLLAILGGTLAMLALGALDDRRGLSPWTRLAAQGIAAGFLVLADLRISLHLLSPFWQIALTIGFVVFLVNATNFIDNMNGLMAGSAAITASCLLLLAAVSGQYFMAAILLCLLGGLLGFLPRNYPQASVFMGDAGTLAVGFLLAALTLAFTFGDSESVLRPLLLPALLLALPIVDGSFVVVTRLSRGVHPFTAGRDHLSHRLVKRGGRPENVVALLWGLALFCATIAGAIAGIDIQWIPVPAVALIALFIVLRRSTHQ